MSGKNGIEAAKSIRRLDRDVLLIYVSSYETYFMQLFEVEPFRFIKKPIKETEFEEAFPYEETSEDYDFNLHAGRIGYHRRPGLHYFSREDWNRFIAFFESKQ